MAPWQQIRAAFKSMMRYTMTSLFVVCDQRQSKVKANMDETYV